MKRLLMFVLRPKWVVFFTHDFPNAEPELGLRIWGVTFSLYKADVLAYSSSSIASFRRPEKREFRESLHPEELTNTR